MSADEQWAECDVLRVGLFPRVPSGHSFDLGDTVSVLVPDGTLQLKVDARTPGHRYLGTVGGSAVVVLPPCTRLDVEEESPGEMLVMALDRAYIDERLGGTRRHMGGSPRAIDPYLHRLGHTLRCAFHSSEAPEPPLLEIVARDLREHLCDRYARHRRRQAQSALGGERLEQALAFMRERFSEKAVGVTEIAGSVGLSPFHFTRMFTVAAGKAPHAYLTQLRITEAKRLLGETCLPIAVIAQRCGYATHAHFTGVFGRHVGVTPARYREEARAERARARVSAGAR